MPTEKSALQRVIEYPRTAQLFANDAMVHNMLWAYDLQWLWLYVQETNPGARNPYHNNAHMLAVARIAFHLYHCEVTREVAHIPHAQAIILVAGLMHDYAHSGGELSDYENIQLALKGLENIAGNLDGQFGEHFYGHVESAIRCTEFPFVREPKNLIEKCIRDADVMQSLEPNGLELIMESLRSEMRSKLTGEMASRADMAAGQIKFLDSIKLYTGCAQRIFDTVKPSMVAAFEAYPTALGGITD